jgi:hypothetical protein
MLTTTITNIAKKSNFTGENFGRNQRSSFVQLSSPQRSPTMRLEFWGAAKHCGTMKTHRRGSQAKRTTLPRH